MKRTLGIAIGLSIGVLMTAAAALATGGTSGVAAYSGPNEAIPTKVAGAPLAATTSPPSGTLPFTGLDLGLALAIGLGLLALGIVLRRSGRRPGNN